ncbi:MAG: ATP-binding cassette, subfamily bacterial, partial [Streptosporangiaceae bacterium]|nr:ATP-binding cassette, subfamily bacterial [Streptosporangiaceae bacterium]
VESRILAALNNGLGSGADDDTAVDDVQDPADRATVVVVAYRKATIALADEVVYIEHGRVLDRGPHHELVERSEGYRNLVNAYERAEAERAEAARADLATGPETDTDTGLGSGAIDSTEEAVA